jgi:hypothetical protein
MNWEIRGRTGRIRSLNPRGAILWLRRDVTRTVNALIRPISARYPAGLSLRVSERILVSRLES